MATESDLLSASVTSTKGADLKHPESLPILIVGAGFAGVTLAQRLEKVLDSTVPILVISRENHMVFTPMLAEVAARTVSPMHVVVAGRQMTRRTRWVSATVTAIDTEAKRVDYSLSYGGMQSAAFSDLIIACGMSVNFSEVPGMAEHALPLKSVDDAFILGNALIERFEQAAAEPDPVIQQQRLTTVVLGGGFSGVEIAGHLHDLAQGMRDLYTFAAGVVPRTIIVQRGSRVIPELQHESLSEFALTKLRQNGVVVELNTSVREVSRSEVHLDPGQRLQYGLLVGTVGNTAAPLVKASGLPLERNRLKVTATMQVEGQESVWAIGDSAIVPNSYDGKPSPPTAQFALRQAAQLARNIARKRSGKPLAPFYFRPQGLLASIGQRNGVAEIYGFKFSGTIAWLLWRAVYLMKMPTFGRKIGIALDWITDTIFGQNLVRVGDRGNPALRKEHFTQGDVVYREGQPSRTLYLIEKGEALIYVSGRAEPVATLRHGEHFGLSAVEAEESSHSTTVIAAGPLDVVAVDRPQLQVMSQDGLTREVVHLLELRRIRQSWTKVIRRFPQIDRLRVRDVMIGNPPSLRQDDTLASAVERIGTAVSLPVLDMGSRLVGMCTRADVSAALARGLDAGTPVRDFSSSPPHTLSPDAALESAASEYLRAGIDQVPVVDAEGRLAGIFGLVEAASMLMRGGNQ